MSTGEPIEVEHRVKTMDSKWKLLRARGMPLRGPSREIVRWYGGCEEIDECKEPEVALR